MLPSAYQASQYLPQFLVSLFTRSIAFARFRLKSGSDCIVDPRCYFEGQNILQRNVRIFNSRVGKYSYIANNSTIAGAIIGRYCSIGSGVTIKLGIHPADFVSTHPLFHSKTHSQSLGFSPFLSADKFETHKFIDKNSNYVVKIGSDVWIGNRVTILDGVSIGDGAIIGAGAVVTKSIPPYQIAVGIPAKPVKCRFCEKDIQRLLRLKWWEKDDEWIIARANSFNSLDDLFSCAGEDQ